MGWSPSDGFGSASGSDPDSSAYSDQNNPNGLGPDAVGHHLYVGSNPKYKTTEMANGQTAYTLIPGTGGAAEDYSQYTGNAQAARGAKAPTTDYSAGNGYVAQGLAARGGQGGALSMIGDRARGGGVSAANLQGTQATNQNTAAQIAAMGGASARGQGIANQQVTGAGGLSATNALGASNAARLGELSGAQNAMFGGYQQQRGQDIGQQKALDERSRYLSDLQMQQRQLNQQGSLAWEGMGQQAINDQLNADVNSAQANQQNWMTAMKQSEADKEQYQKYLTGAAGGAGAVAGFALSDMRAKTKIKYEGR